MEDLGFRVKKEWWCVMGGGRAIFFFNFPPPQKKKNHFKMSDNFGHFLIFSSYIFFVRGRGGVKNIYICLFIYMFFLFKSHPHPLNMEGGGGYKFYFPQISWYIIFTTLAKPLRENLGKGSCCSCSCCYHVKTKSTPRFGLGWEFYKIWTTTRYIFEHYYHKI